MIRLENSSGKVWPCYHDSETREEEIVVTERGRALAELVPIEKAPSLRGSVLEADDIVEPIDVAWEANK